MTSRRPLTRSYSGNGRSNSLNEEDSAPSSRADSRNYLSNVRPENSYSRQRYSHYRPSRSTFCSVMSQLTEETQPCFETTIKSKAVSESCNVKFSCVVTGHPAPEMTWYKDDVELDRYCGLPKYEIFRNGKTHTLHIYNCTLDDAAIYQASARNSKGIVSCSGVLEVGDMSEYKIHQRFFAKLKQKAELKRREMEETRRREREIAQQEQVSVLTQDRIMRKRRTPDSLNSSDSAQEAEEAVEETTEAATETPAEEVNGEAMETATMEASDVVQENGNQEIKHVSDTVEIVTTKLPNKEKLAKKKIRISNGFDESVVASGQTDSVSGNEKHTSELDMSLAQYLSQTVQSQAAKNKQSSIPAQTTMEVDIAGQQEKEKEIEYEREKERKHEKERELEKERQGEKERERDKERKRLQKEQELSHKEKERAKQMAEAKKTAGKESNKAKKSNSDPQQKSTLTTVLTSLKDIFFGKSKNKSIEAPEETSSTNETSCGPAEQAMEVEEQSLSTSDQTVENIAECPRTPRLPQSLRMLNGHGITETTAVGSSVAPQTPEAPKEERLLAPIEEPMLPMEKEPVSAEEMGPSLKEKPPSPPPSLPVPESLPPAQAIDDQPVQSDRCESPIQEGNASAVPEHDTEDRAFFTEPVTGDVGDILSLQGPPGDSGQTSAASLTDQVAINLESIDSHGTLLDLPIATEAEKEEKMHVDKGVVECEIAAQLTDAISSTEGRPEASEPVEYEVDTTAVTESVSEICTTAIVKKTEITSTAVQKVEEGEEKVTEASEPEEVIEVQVRLEEKISDSQGDMMEVSSVAPPLGDTAENTEQMAKVPDEDLIKDASVASVVEGQRVESSGTETKEEVEEMETEVRTVEAAEVQHEGPDYQAKTPVIMPPALALQREAQTEKDREAPGLPKKDTVEIPTSGEENVTSAEVPGLTVTKIPDIKISTNVGIQEQLPINIPTINIQITEPEESKPVVLVTHHLAGLQGDATQLSDPMIVEPSATVVSTHVSVPPTPDSSGNAGVLPSIKDMQEVAQAQEGERMSLVKETEHAKTSSKVDSFSIPTINIAEKMTVMLSSHEEGDKPVEVLVASNTAQQEEAHKKPAFAPPPIEITCVGITPEVIKVNNNKQDKDMESLATILWGVKNNIDQKSYVADPEKVSEAKEQPLTESKSVPPSALLTPQSPEAEHTLPVPTVPVKTPQISISNADKTDVPKEPDISVDRPKKDRSAVEKLGVSAQLPPMMSPSSLRRLMAKGLLGTDNPIVTSIPAITVDSEGRSEENSGGSTPSSVLSCESSPKVRRKDSPSPIPSATPEELASGARRKIFLSKIKVDEVDIVVSPDAQGKREAPYLSPSQARRAAFLQAHSGQKTPPMERRSPLLNRRKATLEVPKVQETPEETEPVKTEVKPAERLDPFKAPQVIRKIRGEPFSDATGHLKLWCQFFNVLSDSTITWFRDEVELLEVKRSAGDESQVALAIIQASSRDCGVFACTIKNDFGTDTTDFLLSTDILAEFLLRDELEVGEEIEMTPLLFTKGLADPGSWGDKFFGRIMVEEMHLGEGIAHKACRVKVIYGLDPVFESGSTCITKVRNFIVYGTKEESSLIERNLEITKQLCRMQNIVREYCKIFAAEARVIENFGPALEVSPVYLMYRPANTVPYATVEAELKGTYLRYCFMDSSGGLVTRTTSEVEQKCSTFQHWIYQWTNGNLLVTQLEGVDMKVTNIRIATKTKGYQGLTEDTSPKVLEQFLTHHQCNYYCGLMGLRPLKPMDALQQPSKMKGSRSPLLNRKAGSSSPQLQKKGTGSPQTPRKITSSPKVARKSAEAGDGSATPTTKHKTVEIPKVVRMR